MPSLIKFVSICLLIFGICYGTLFAIAVIYEPKTRLITTEVSLEKLKE